MLQRLQYKKRRKKYYKKNNLINYPKNNKYFTTHNPHFEDYENEIICIEPGLFYIPKTKKGITTIETYELSRFYLIKAEIYETNSGNFNLIQKLTNKLMESTDEKDKLMILLSLKSLTENSIKKLTPKLIEMD